MRWTDERIADGLRSIDTAASREDVRPTAAEWARLDRAMATPRARPREAIRFAWIVPLAAAATAVAIVLGISPGEPEQAVAATPPILATEPIDASLEQVVDASVDALDAADDAGSLGGWRVSWRYDAQAADETMIAPYWARWVWDDAETGHLETLPGEAYRVEDGEIVEADDPLPPAAEGLTTEEWAEAEYQGWFFAEPPSAPDELAGYLAEHAYLPDGADGIQVWGALDALLDERLLSSEQTSAALELLTDTGDVEVLGEVADRLGREGVALSVTSDARPHFAVTVVLGAESGRFIAADVVYLGGAETLGLPADTVIEYTAWDASPEE